MPILLLSPGRKLDRWTEALRKTDPAVPVFLPEDKVPERDISFILAWDHPRGCFVRYPGLRCISSFGAGVDHLVSDREIPENVRLVRIIDPALSNDMLEFTLAVIMKHLRKLNIYNSYKTEVKWKKHGYRRIRETGVGIMGTGVIGHHVADGLSRIGFDVSGWSRTMGGKASYRKFHGVEQLNEFLSRCEILVCLLPLTDETRGIIDYHLLKSLPGDAYLVNLGRGAHIVEADLFRALDKGLISGAHLDVFESEPLFEAHPFWKNSKIDITPHVASLTDPLSVAPQIMENYHLVMQGREPKNQVSRSRGY